MQERRKLQRFEIDTTARVLIESGTNKKVEYSLATRDISSAGAFLFAPQPIPKGTSVKIEFLISLDALQKITGDGGRAKVRVEGQVIRSDSNGIAIRFVSKYKITAFGNNKWASWLLLFPDVI